jgi:hypothetical protein
MINSKCNKCNVLLSEENKSSKLNNCKPCYNAYHRAAFQKYKDKHRELMYKWRKENKDKVRKMLVNNAVKTHGTVSKSVNHYLKKYNEQVTDTYVKSLLTKSKKKSILKFSDIPQDLIELKRKEILLKRQIA